VVSSQDASRAPTRNHQVHTNSAPCLRSRPLCIHYENRLLTLERRHSPLARDLPYFFKREKLGWLYLPGNLLAPCHRVGSGHSTPKIGCTLIRTIQPVSSLIPRTLHNKFPHNIITVVCREQLHNSSTPRFGVQVPISTFY
jgi:hypothetical protein